MFSLGALGFLQPLFLAGLLALPLLWFLLRATPPAPTRIRFPGVRVLLGLADRERTPQRTPLWLLLLRMAAAALLLLAFAEPLVNPKARSAGSGPVLVILDGGWTSADSWSARVGAAQDALRQAAETGRPAALISLSSAEPPPERLNFGPAEEAMRRVEALEPAPWRPDPRRWIAAIEAEDALETVWIHDGLEAPTPPPEAAVSDDDAGALTAKAALAALLSERGSLTLIAAADPTRALAPPRIEGGALTATVLRAQGGAVETRRVAAFGGDPAAGGARRVGAAEVAFEADDLQAEGVFDLPVQLRNTLEKLQIDGLRHAGAVALLDDRFRRRRVALVSGEQERRGLPLLSGLHYLRAALAPHAAARETTLRAAMGLTEDPIEAAVFGAAAAAAPLAGWADAIVLSDVGRIDPETEAALIAWVQEGGLLIRFAGPKLAALAIERDDAFRRGARRGASRPLDPLLPVRLRGGGRALGGALSWSQPQRVAPFPADGPFAGLEPRAEVSVTRQVLAQPSAGSTEEVWARLGDGTPIVTARDEGEGRVVLFHLTANAAWSSLPLSGLFVDMMGRLVAEAPALAGAFGDVSAPAEDPERDPNETETVVDEAGVDIGAANEGDNSSRAPDTAQQGPGPAGAGPAAEPATPGSLSALWRPVLLMDGHGGLSRADASAPPTTGEALALAARFGSRPGAPPGLYERADKAGQAPGGGGTDLDGAGRVAINAVGSAPEAALLRPFAGAPAAAAQLALTEREEIALKPALLAGALALLAIDALAALFIAGRLRVAKGAAALLVAVAAGWLGLHSGSALAQAGGERAERDAPLVDPAARRAGLETVFAYVKTGDSRVDQVSEAGLRGLQQILANRTAIEPGAPAGVDPARDEIAVYAVLYWPITPDQDDLTDAAVRRLNAFMRTGGLLVVDSRDAHQTFGDGDGPNARHVRRLLEPLDLPPLAAIDRDHVLTRTFYILEDAPGRWPGEPIFAAVGSGGGAAAAGERDRAAGDVNDGVSPIIVGSVDWIGAWAVDARGRPLFPPGRGGDRRREMALRFGVNLAMYAYTGNYKSDQVHIDALLDRLDT